MATPPANLQIANVSPDTRAYIGANNVTGQVKFEDNGLGWYLWDTSAQVYKQAGPSITLAMGLTECCAKHGHGKVSIKYLYSFQDRNADGQKVFYFAKDFTSDYDIPDGYTEAYAKLPDLLYVDYVWDERSKNEWFNMPQSQRMDALNARGNALYHAIPVIPISLVFDHDSYDNIRMTEGLHGAISLYLNSSGYLYLGFIQDMSAHMDWYTPGRREARPTLDTPGKRAFWQAEKTQVAQFQCMSGPDAVQRLQGFLAERRPESLYLFAQIMSLFMQAHGQAHGR